MLLYAFQLAVGALGTQIVHELGHLLVARAFGINAVTVAIGIGPTVARFTDGSGTCWKFGLLPFVSGCAFPDGPAPRQPRSPRRPVGPRSIRSISPGRRAIIVLAGPLSNVALAGALLLATYVQDSSFSISRLGTTVANLSLLICGFSMAVALFNLLPIFPLDGGRLVLLAYEVLTGREIPRESEMRLFASGLVLLSIIAALAAFLFFAAPSLKGS